MKPPARHASAWAIFYLALAIAWSWPLPLHLGARFAHDPGDPLLVTYLLWWNAHTLPLSRAMWNAPFYWPLHDALALTEHGLGLSVIGSPIQWVGGSPLLAYNLLLIASPWWSGLAAHALVRRLTSSTPAAVTAGLAYGFAPYRAGQLAHLQMLASWWIPLALLGLHEYYRTARTRWLTLFGLSWLLTGLTNGYFLLFVPVLLVACWIALTPWRTRPATALKPAAAFLVTSLPLVPVLLEYRDVQVWLGLTRTQDENLLYSAHLVSFLHAAPLLALWPARDVRTQEDFLFPGLTAIGLVVVALVHGVWRDRLRRTFFFYLSAAIGCAWLAMGPASPDRILSLLWHPFSWIDWVPGFSGLRVPERFFALTTLCLAVAAGVAVAHLGAGRARRTRVIACVAACGLLADGWIVAMPLGVPPRDLGVPTTDARVLELPFDDAAVSVQALYRGMSHRMPVVNGYAGYVPPHATVLDWALHRHDDTVVTELRRGHPLIMVIGQSSEEEEWTRFAEAQPGAQMLGVTGAGRIYQVPAAPYVAEPRVGPSIPFVHAGSASGWLAGDLGTPQIVRFVEVMTGGDVGRLPTSLTIETSLTGAEWHVASDARPGGAAFLGVLSDPRGVPVRVLVPDLTARYIRVNAPTFEPASLRVYGP